MAIFPKHIAIIMDGNGRWARQRGLPRFRGHKAGSVAARRVIDYCCKKNIQALTLWAFGIENWQRPTAEVRYLMELFYRMLKKNIKEMSSNNIKLRVIGERSDLSPKIADIINQAEELTKNNRGLNLNIAFNYSGRWDILQAVKKTVSAVINHEIIAKEIDYAYFQSLLSLAEMPEPDFFVRTSGELRLSNFLLWQLAYTEFYFTNVFWPDFDEFELEKAINEFNKRERRFGKVVNTDN